MTAATRRTLMLAILAAAVAAAGRLRAEDAGGWVTDEKSGCRAWNPHPQANEAIRWSGTCVAGLAEGRGTLTWLRAGSPYETDDGEWRQGHQMGQATQSWPGGRYVGDVVDGLPHGRGILDAGRARYEGEFRNGKADGAGTLTVGDKIYRGRWSAGCFDDGKQRASIGVAAAACH